jgi:hypothetical protein
MITTKLRTPPQSSIVTGSKLGRKFDKEEEEGRRWSQLEGRKKILVRRGQPTCSARSRKLLLRHQDHPPVNQQDLQAGHHHLHAVGMLCKLLEAVRGGGKGIKDRRTTLRGLYFQPYMN